MEHLGASTIQGNLLALNSGRSGLPASVDIRPLLTRSGTGAPRLAQRGPRMPTAGQGAPSPDRSGRGKSDALSASANSSKQSEGCWNKWPAVEGLWWRGRMRRSQEIAIEIRTFIAKGAGIEKVYVSSERNGVVEKVRKEIKAVGEVGGIKGGNLGEWSSSSGKWLGVCNVCWDPWMKGLSRKSNTVFLNIILIAFAIALSFSPWNLISMEAMVGAPCHYPAARWTFILDGVVQVQRLQLLERRLISCTLEQLLTLGLWGTVHWQPGIDCGQQVNDLFLPVQQEK